MSAAPARGACFGFEIRSTMSFEYLREGRGEPLWVTVESVSARPSPEDLIVEYVPTPDRPLEGRLYGRNGKFLLWAGGAASGWYSIDPGAPSVTVPETDDALRREERLWSIPAVLCFLHRGDLPLHAAAVETDGSAVVLAAPRTFGKTTLAAAVVASGGRLLTEDVCCTRLDTEPSIVPGPAMLRVRPDLAEYLELTFGEEAGPRDDRVHVSVNHEHRGDCSPVPIRALVMLREAEEGVTLDRVAPEEALRDLWGLIFKLPGEAAYRRGFAALTDLAARVPLWNVSYPRRLDYLPAIVERLHNDV
jgi:hypothetical protein